MNILSLEAVKKSFGAGPVLEEISFGLEHNERAGIIGRNGSGKTTLLRIISGNETPDSGRVVMATGKLIASVPQNPVFEGNQTVLDAVFQSDNEKLHTLRDYLSACKKLETHHEENPELLEQISNLEHILDIHGGWDLEANAKSILARLGLSDYNKRVDLLSGGQRKRLALARGLIIKPDLLILDEPTNHIDVETIVWLENYLSKFSGALLLVTHDRYFLDRVANRIFEIDKGRIKRYDGNYTKYLEKKEEEELLQQQDAVKHEGMVRRELAWLRQGAKARSTKQKAHVERATKLISESKVEKNKSIELGAPVTRLGNKILEIECISKSFSEKALFKNFSYKLKDRDRIGIVGSNGSGKTTLLEILSGRISPDSGTIVSGETVVIGYYDQESRALEEGMRIIDYIRESADNIKTSDGQIVSATKMLERFLFAPAQHFTPISRLSGGERRRLYLLHLLMQAPNVLLLDEPTNDFDIATLSALENYLESFPGCLIVASHDRYFLDRTVDHLFRIEANGEIRSYVGTFSELLTRSEEKNEQKNERSTEQKNVQKNSQKCEQNSDLMNDQKNEQKKAQNITQTTSPAVRKLSFKERQELDFLEKKIQTDELRKAEIETLLQTPSDDFTAISNLTRELQSLDEVLEKNLNRWAELAE
ncbi:MAG: ABC-F family ATP-binding cassette domain-containing protein [Candidatus Riflebacteria bacterium]|nr:ABC-F family ATP-binding cassette domain-containing protein [Candidatus Riflebacteria bacterium]